MSHGSPNRRLTTSLIALDELKRREDLESLRPFLIAEQCFPSSKDPETSMITMEELKKLVRIWKLNERRNFWKTHSERDDLVSALLQHAQQMTHYSPGKFNKHKIGDNIIALKPNPPPDTKPSHKHNHQRKKIFLFSMQNISFFQCKFYLHLYSLCFPPGQ